MKKENAFKIILIVALVLTGIAIYNDQREIEKLTTQLAKSRQTLTEIGQKNLELETALNDCRDSIDIHPANGVYTEAQMDEMDRRIKEHESQ